MNSLKLNFICSHLCNLQQKCSIILSQLWQVFFFLVFFLRLHSLTMCLYFYTILSVILVCCLYSSHNIVVVIFSINDEIVVVLLYLHKIVQYFVDILYWNWPVAVGCQSVVLANQQTSYSEVHNTNTIVKSGLQ